MPRRRSSSDDEATDHRAAADGPAGRGYQQVPVRVFVNAEGKRRIVVDVSDALSLREAARLSRQLKDQRRQAKNQRRHVEGGRETAAKAKSDKATRVEEAHQFAATFTGETGMVAWIARKLRCSTRSVRRYLKEKP